MIRSQVPSGWRRTTCARPPVPSSARVDVSARSPTLRLGQQALEDGADRVAPHGHLAGREAEHGVGRVQLGDPLGVAGAGALDDEPGQVLGGLRTFADGAHDVPPFESDGSIVARGIQNANI
jgi:hypothetical protein